MKQVYEIFNSFVDPIFIIFILLLISLFVCLFSGKKKNDTLLIFFTVILLYGFSIYPVSNYFGYQLEKDYINNPAQDKSKLDVIVVLSGGTYDINTLDKTFSSNATNTRLLSALKMYKKYNAQYLVCSGKSDGRISNAELMAQIAEEFGIPKDRIRVEAKSQNTYEHAMELDKMFADKDIKIGLVTSAYHMKRSEMAVRKFFKNVIPLPAGYIYSSPMGTVAVRYIPNSQFLYHNALALHEHVGRFWYAVKEM